MNTSLAAHPVAEIFPMMSDEELQELAEDIKENGLIHQIVLGEWENEDGQVVEGIVDGRNRYRACQIAKVEPQFVRLNGQDLRAFIVSANLERRNLTKGQQAMALAMIYPKSKRGRGNKDEAIKGDVSSSFSQKRLELARLVLKHAPDLADLVLSAAKGLDEACEEARKRRDAANSEEARMTRLRTECPEFADLVDEGRMSLSQAYVAMEQKKREDEEMERSKREAIFRITDGASFDTLAWFNQDFRAGVNDLIKEPGFREAMIKRMRIKPNEINDVEQGARYLIDFLNNLFDGELA